MRTPFVRSLLLCTLLLLASAFPAFAGAPPPPSPPPPSPPPSAPPLATRAVDAVAAAESVDDAHYYRWIGDAQREVGALPAALESYQRALELYTVAGLPFEVAAMHHKIGSIHILREELPPAIHDVAEAVRLFREGGDEHQASLAEALETLAAAYLRANDLRAAQVAFAETAELYAAVGNNAGLADVYAQLGQLWAQLTEYDLARQSFDRARALYTENGDGPGQVDVIYWQAQADIQEGVARARSDPEDAHHIFRRSIANIEQGLDLIETMDEPDLWGKGFLLEALAETAASLNDPQETERLLPRLESDIADLTDPGTRGPALEALGILYAQLGRFTEARTLLEQSIAIFLKSDDTGSAAQVYGSLGISHAMESDWEGAIAPLERGLELASSLVDPGAQRGDGSLLVDTRLTDNYQALATAYVEVGRLEDAFNIAEEGRARSLFSQLAQTYAGAAAPAPHLAEVQARLRPDETLVTYSYLLFGSSIVAFVVTHDSFEAVRLQLSPADAAELLLAFETTVQSDEPGPEQASLDALTALHSALFAPIAPLITTPRLLIVPTGNLYSTPFSALRAPDGRFLGDDHELSLLPGAGAIALRGDAPQNDAPLTALVLAQHEAPGLPRLDYADDEAAAVATLFDTQAWTGADATETRLRAEAGNHAIIHVAAHGVNDALQPLASRLVLGADTLNDGMLDVRELSGLDLSHTRLVTLSACETATGDVIAGDEVSGLTSALLYARAPAIVSSLWKVDDVSTRTLMEAFYSALNQGMGTAAALQQAQAELRTRPGFAHPYYWAPFVLTGNADPILPN